MFRRKKPYVIGLYFFAVVSLTLVWGFNSMSQADSITNSQSHDPESNFTSGRLSAFQQVQLFKKMLKQHNWVGTALLVRDGKPVYYQGSGYANQSSGIKNTQNTEYLINSTQKSMTGTVVMKVISMGELSLNDHLSKWYPSIPNSNNITIRQMLDMTSGLEGPMKLPSKVLTSAKVTDFLAQNTKSDVAKYGQWNYQDINYNLLCGIIQKQTGHDFQWWYNQEFIKRFHLKQTIFSYQTNIEDDHKLALGYQGNNTDAIVYHRTSNTKFSRPEQVAALGSGNLYMSGMDLFRAEAVICRGEVIDRAMLKILRQPGSPSTYGGGVYVRPTGYVVANGVAHGFVEMFAISSDGRNGIVMLSNLWRPEGQDRTFFFKLAKMEAYQQW